MRFVQRLHSHLLALPHPAQATLKIFDVTGREVAVLVDEQAAAGERSVVFNAVGLASGIYFAELEVSGVARTKKMLLIR